MNNGLPQTESDPLYKVIFYYSRLAARHKQKRLFIIDYIFQRADASTVSDDATDDGNFELQVHHNPEEEKETSILRDVLFKVISQVIS